MSILTKEERIKWRRWCEPDTYIFKGHELSRALDTIDALERTIKDIERATSKHQVETVLIAARAFGIIEEDGE